MQQWLSKPLDTLRTTLAAAEAFQTFVGVANATAAAKAIHEFEAVGEEFAIESLTPGLAGTASLVIAENVEEYFQTGSVIRIRRSGADDGLYTVRAGSGYADGETTLNVDEAIAGTDPAGVCILQPAPCAIIGRNGGAARRRRGTRSWESDVDGSLWVMFLWEPGSGEYDRDQQLDKVQSQYRTFLDLIEDIIDDLETLFGQGSYLNCKQIREADAATRAPLQETGGVPIWMLTLELGSA